MPAAAVNSEEILAAVGKIVAEETAKITAAFDAKLSKISSTHKPAKGVINANATAEKSVHSRLDEVTGKIREEIVKSRKA